MQLTRLVDVVFDVLTDDPAVESCAFFHFRVRQQFARLFGRIEETLPQSGDCDDVGQESIAEVIPKCSLAEFVGLRLREAGMLVLE